MIGWRFSQYKISVDQNSIFERLLYIFKDVLIHSSGNIDESVSWLTAIDNEHNITTEEYGIGDFIQELIDKGFLKQDNIERFSFIPSSKFEIALRKFALDSIFEQLKKSKRGDHITKFTGKGNEQSSEIRPYQFGDDLEKLAITESIKNAQINHGIDNFYLDENDLEIKDSYYKTNMATVLMIDISHSMILYGEDRITPAKKVAMALAELIKTNYPKDHLDIIVFGNDAWKIEIKDLPYLKVGPYHTNTVAGLELAMDLLRKKRAHNKQILMITDGKPTCIKKGKKYYKNSWGLDRTILNRTIGLAIKCRKLNIPITTFMIAKDEWLVKFVEKFTKANSGKAFYSSLSNLGEFIFKDYRNNSRKSR